MATVDSVERKKVVADRAACDNATTVCLILGPVLAVLGIIADAANINLGLEPISWFLLAIATFLAAIVFRMGWAVSWYLGTAK